MNLEIVLANNPSAYTAAGTNTYLLDFDVAVVVIDPGPTMDGHMDAVVEAVGSRTTAAVIVTHRHPDHAPAAQPVADRLSAPVFAMDPTPSFDSKIVIDDGMEIDIGGEKLRCVHTPGHTDDSVTITWNGQAFIGDVLMGESTVIIEDLTAYLDSLEALAALDLAVMHPGHGPAISDPTSRLHEVIAHRLSRNDQIVAAIESGAETVGAIRSHVYPDLNPALHVAAEGSVRTHLTHLMEMGTVPKLDY